MKQAASRSLAHSRACLLKRAQNLSDLQASKLKEILSYNLRSARTYLLHSPHNVLRIDIPFVRSDIRIASHSVGKLRSHSLPPTPPQQHLEPLRSRTSSPLFQQDTPTDQKKFLARYPLRKYTLVR